MNSHYCHTDSPPGQSVSGSWDLSLLGGGGGRRRRAHRGEEGGDARRDAGAEERCPRPRWGKCGADRLTGGGSDRRNGRPPRKNIPPATIDPYPD